MHKNLESYLEEIGHYLADPAERGEILNEIRSHIMEKAEREGGPVDDASVERIIAAFGTPRQVADRYVEDRPIIAPVFRRHLFRYTSLLFAVHLAFTVFAVAFQSSFVIFPFLYMPRLGIIEAVMYLPMAFLADFGSVALVLVVITRRNKEVRLPWPKLALDLDQVKARTVGATIGNLLGGGVMLAVAWILLLLQQTHGAFFLVRVRTREFLPLLQPGPGRWLSLMVIALLVVGALERFIKAFARSWRLRCWVTAVVDGFALLMIAAALGVRHAGMFTAHVPARLHAWMYKSLTWTLLVTALIVAVDLVTSLVRLGRGRLAEKNRAGEEQK